MFVALCDGQLPDGRPEDAASRDRKTTLGLQGHCRRWPANQATLLTAAAGSLGTQGYLNHEGDFLRRSKSHCTIIALLLGPEALKLG